MRTFDLRKNEFETIYRNIQIRDIRKVDDNVNMTVYLWKSDKYMDTCIRNENPEYSDFNVKDNIIIQSNFHPTTRAKIWQIEPIHGGCCIVLYTTLTKPCAKIWLDRQSLINK
jgi:hypothetical protein